MPRGFEEIYGILTKYVRRYSRSCLFEPLPLHSFWRFVVFWRFSRRGGPCPLFPCAALRQPPPPVSAATGLVSCPDSSCEQGHELRYLASVVVPRFRGGLRPFHPLHPYLYSSACLGLSLFFLLVDFECFGVSRIEVVLISQSVARLFCTRPRRFLLRRGPPRPRLRRAQAACADSGMN